MPERSGVDRRLDDIHCNNHDKNTADINKLKGYVGIIALLGMPVIGYYVGSIDKKMEKAADKQETIITMVHENKNITLGIAAEQDRLKHEVVEIHNKINTPLTIRNRNKF